MMFARGSFGNYGCFGSGLFGGGMHILLTIGIILATVAVIVYFVRKSKQNPSNNPALELLNMKLVQGEISEEEYLKKKEVLVKK